MKKFCKKLSDGLRIAFGYSIMLCLFAGGLTFFGYVAALCIGGDAAAEICRVISKVITPWIIKITSVTVLVGILVMYLSGEVALTARKKEK
jgi:hypothetical protein